MSRTLPLLLSLSLLAGAAPAAALSALSPDAPKDKTGHIHGDEQWQRFQNAVTPYIEQARKTWPEAKRHYLAGLPPHHVFFVTARLVGANGAFELVFVEVKKIDHAMVTGQIANDIVSVREYHMGQTITVPESEIWDWTVSRPDGSEEGNVVGKFLEHYRP